MSGELLLHQYADRRQSITLNEIVEEICNRVNDPYEDTYADRARDLFISSVFQNMKDPKWSRFDYHGLVGSKVLSTNQDKRTFTVLGAPNEITVNSRYIIDVLNVVSNDLSEANERTRKFVPIDISEANRIATDSELEPIVGEVYWYLLGEKLYFYPNANESMKGLSFVIEYLFNPFRFRKNDDMLKYYSVNFVFEAIDTTVGKLLSEIGLA